MNHSCLKQVVKPIVSVVTGLYSGERGERVGPPSTAFSIAYTLATTGLILFKI